MALEGINNEGAFDQIDLLDAELSTRFIALDPKGYFIIKLDESLKEIVVEHYGNDIDEHGRAVDQVTGELLQCRGGQQRVSIKVYQGRTAKEVGIKLTEGTPPFPLSSLDHALYLGRELQKAESCMRNKQHYVQD